MRVRNWIIIATILSVFFAACGGKSDSELESAALAALRGEPATENVSAKVSDRVVTLAGEVANDAEKAKAAELAMVEGMKSVKNDIRVTAAPPPVSSASDADLQKTIRIALEARGCPDAAVRVKDGVAILSGTVEKDKMGECVMAASQSVLKVENGLKNKE